MPNLRKILILASALLCIAFLVQFGLSVYEDATWPEPSPGFAVDAAPQYSLGLYHGLSIFLLLSIIFAKRYSTSFFLSMGYLFVHIYGTRERLCTGFLGGDLCPDGGFSFWAISRATWFDWTSTGLLLIIFWIVLVYIFIWRRTQTLTNNQTPKS
jgi:hypothetical protein